MAMNATGGPNSTPFGQDEYAKRLEHVSISYRIGRNTADKYRSKHCARSCASASSTRAA
jgi:hypothetical protein